MQPVVSILLSIAIASIDAFTFALFFERFLGRKYGSGRLYFIVYFLYLALNVCLSMLYMEVIAAFSVISCFGISYSLYSGTRTQRIFCGGLLTAYLFVSEIATMLALSFFFEYALVDVASNALVFYAGAFVSKTVAIGIAVFISSNRLKPLTPVPHYYHMLLLAITYICVGLSYAVFFFVNQSDAPATAIHVLSELAVFVLSILVYFVFENFQKYAEQETYTTVLIQQLSHDERRFRLIDSQISEIRGLKHDLTNHLMCIRRLSNDQQFENLSDYLDEYLPKAEDVVTKLYTGIPGLDSVLSEKTAIAEYGNIRVDINIEVPLEFSFSPVHLNIILGNALDNAIEACNKLPNHHNRYISLDMKTDCDWLDIRMVNSSLPVKIVPGGLPLTDKADKAHHGMGLSIINQLVCRNDGAMLCRIEDEEFVLLVRIKCGLGGGAL